MAKLRKLKITEGSLCPAGANQHAEVLLFKSDQPGTPEAIAKAERLTASVNTAVDEVQTLMKQSNGGRNRVALEKAGEFLRDPQVWEAWRHRERGERWTAPVEKAVPDHRPAIFEFVRKRDWKAMEQLFESDRTSWPQYEELRRSGALATA